MLWRKKQPPAQIFSFSCANQGIYMKKNKKKKPTPCFFRNFHFLKCGLFIHTEPWRSSFLSTVLPEAILLICRHLQEKKVWTTFFYICFLGKMVCFTAESPPLPELIIPVLLSWVLFWQLLAVKAGNSRRSATAQILPQAQPAVFYPPCHLIIW